MNGSFDRLAEQYRDLQNAPWQRLRHTVVIANLRRHLDPGHRTWLDVGGGDGALAADLAAGGVSVTLVEPESDMIAAAGVRLAAAGVLDRCRLETAAAEQVPDIVAGQVDGLSLHNVLEYTVDWAAALRSCVRAVRPDGLVSVLVSNLYGQLLGEAARGRDPRNLVARLRDRRLVVGLAGRRYHRPWIPADGIERCLAEAGVTVTGRYGVRVVNDVITANCSEPEDPEALLELELVASRDPVLWQVARHIHLIGTVRSSA